MILTMDPHSDRGAPPRHQQFGAASPPILPAPIAAAQSVPVASALGLAPNCGPAMGAPFMGSKRVTPIPSSASSVTSSSGSDTEASGAVLSAAAVAAAYPHLGAHNMIAGSVSGSVAGSVVGSMPGSGSGTPNPAGGAVMGLGVGSVIGVASANGAPAPAAMTLPRSGPASILPAMPTVALSAGPLAMAAAAHAAAASAHGSNSPHHPVAEFLYQLTKMLTDDNRELIEWSGGRIHVHHPQRLADETLHRYFRHSNYASFQRQLNYFGFRKIAGKGKMSPCSYVNDAATEDIRSLLFIKRKTNGGGRKPTAANSGGGKAGTKRKLDTNGATSDTSSTPPPSVQPFLKKNAPIRPAPAPSVTQPRLDSSTYVAAVAGVPIAPNPYTPNYGAPGAAVGNGSPFGASGALLTQENFHFPPSEGGVSAVSSAPAPTPMTKGSLEALEALAQSAQAADGFVDPLKSLSGGFGSTAMTQSAAASMPCPATAAMNAAMSGTNGAYDNPNLTSLLAEHQHPLGMLGSQGADGSTGAKSRLLGSLPSAGTIFPDSLSTSELGRNQGAVAAVPGAAARRGSGLSSGRFAPGGRIASSSFLNLTNGLISRESSLADLATLPGAFPSMASFQQIAREAAQMGAGETRFDPTPILDMGQGQGGAGQIMGGQTQVQRMPGRPGC